MKLRRLFFIFLFASIFITMEIKVLAEGENSGDPTVAEVFEDQKSDEGNLEQTGGDNGEPATSTTDTIWIFVKMIVALGFVIALIYILLRFVNSKTKAAGDGKVLKNIGGVGVASNRSVQLIKVGDKILVVGVGDTVTLLKEIDDPDVVQEMTAESAMVPMEGSFSKIKDVITNWSSKNVSKEERPVFSNILESRLNSIREERKQAYDHLSEKESDK